ncbi:hypothetical protein NEOLEDRAFT_1180365 [Neolentinus lepideus HHB14362 ss-1]|uniref:Uncharacterized protein n=1 Tax=Neolentinus lepideus HHB14362 ss-1 TaxID=1314782 RepID=A0A165R0S2_9AGAM|nr:hypothetical protein NEOLEDRAFT_1180365 [Neolentinus lepideus HHB14362 ss-1]
MTGLKKDGPEVTPRKSGRKSLPSRRLGSPVSITSSQRALLSDESTPSCTDSIPRKSGADEDAVTLTTAIAGAKAQAKKKKQRVIVIEETDDEDEDEDGNAARALKIKETPQSTIPSNSTASVVVENRSPDFAPAHKVSGVRRSSAKSMQGKSRTIVRSDDDKSGSADDGPSTRLQGTKGVTVKGDRWEVPEDFDLDILSDVDFPPASQLLAEKFSKDDAAAITKVNGKILVRGTKRAVVTSDAENESTALASGNSSSKRNRTEGRPTITKIVQTTSKVKSSDADIVPSDEDDAPVVRNHQSDDEKTTDEEADDLPHVSGAQSDNDAVVPLVRPAGQSPVDDPAEDGKTRDNADADALEVGALIDHAQIRTVDAVWEIVTADTLLADTYTDLPLLQRTCELYPSSDFVRNRADGQVSFSAWGEHIDCHNFPRCLGEGLCEHRRASMNYIKSAIVFQRKDIQMDNYINLSRINPSILDISSGNQPSICVDGNRTHPAICVSVIAVTECYLIRPVQFGNYLQKTIYGVLHTVEWERFSTVACQTFNAIGGMKARLDGNSIQFSTRSFKIADDAAGPSSQRSAPSTPSRSGKAPKTSLFSPAKSDNVKAVPGNKASGIRVLDPSDDVPIYDARLSVLDRPLQFQKWIDRIPQLGLPRYRKEIRPGSSALVFYTANRWFQRGDTSQMPNLSLNVQWVVLLTSPPI